MGGGVADLDNDGYLDVYIGTGDPQISRLEPNRLFRNNGDGTFSDLTNFVGLARPGNKGHGVAFVDIDDDGALDMFAQLGGHYPGDHAYNAFYRNLKAAQNHWLELELTGVKSNRQAVGAQTHGEGRRPAGLSRSQGQRRLRQHQHVAPALRLGPAREDRFPGDPLAQRRHAQVHQRGCQPNPPPERNDPTFTKSQP